MNRGFSIAIIVSQRNFPLGSEEFANWKIFTVRWIVNFLGPFSAHISFVVVFVLISGTYGMFHYWSEIPKKNKIAGTCLSISSHFCVTCFLRQSPKWPRTWKKHSRCEPKCGGWFNDSTGNEQHCNILQCAVVVLLKLGMFACHRYLTSWVLNQVCSFGQR
jgi:hypothetical protein